MVGSKDHLQSMLAGESRAYGFTIAFWGSGALLINEFGAPDIWLALSFGFGAVLGFGVLALSAFRGDRAQSSDQALLVLSTVHYLSSLLPMVITSILIRIDLPAALTFLLAGMSVSLMYNLLSILEETIAEKITNILR